MLPTRREWTKAALVAVIGGHAARAQEQGPSPGAALTGAATRFVDALPAADRGKACLARDDAERFNWHFVPLNDAKTRLPTRKGIAIADLRDEAKTALWDMLKAGTSADGFCWCRNIMEREAVLAELEPQNAWFRKPDWYFVTIFGKPAATGRWAWRLDGHHLSGNFSVIDGELGSTSPCFMGVNPVTIKHGQKQGLRDTITPAEDVARELFIALTPDQQKSVLLPKHLPEVAGKTAKAPTNLPPGLSASKMTAKQHALLTKLINHYTGRMAASAAKTETDKWTKAGLDRVTFAYSGEPEAGKRHTYAVQSPTFLIHYLNEQTDPHKNPANHIHSVYRSLGGDFGGAA